MQIDWIVWSCGVPRLLIPILTSLSHPYSSRKVEVFGFELVSPRWLKKSEPKEEFLKADPGHSFGAQTNSRCCPEKSERERKRGTHVTLINRRGSGFSLAAVKSEPLTNTNSWQFPRRSSPDLVWFFGPLPLITYCSRHMGLEPGLLPSSVLHLLTVAIHYVLFPLTDVACPISYILYPIYHISYPDVDWVRSSSWSLVISQLR